MVSLPLEQKVNCSWVTIVTRIVQRRPLSVVKSHDVCTFSQQEFDTLLAALSASEMEGCALLLVLGFDMSLGIEKALNNFDVVLKSSEVKRRLELVGEWVDFCLGIF